MPKFERGNKGKPKGSPNIITQSARELFKATLEAQVPSIMQAFEDVRADDPAKFLELFAKYAQYFVPKQIDLTTDGSQIRQVFKIGGVEIEL